MGKRWSRVRAWLVESGVGAPRLESEEQHRVFRIFLVVAAMAELLGPAADLLLYLQGIQPQAFYPTSIWNAAFMGLFGFALLSLERSGVRLAARLVAWGGLLLGLPALHHLGGVHSAATLFLLVPVIVGAFFFRPFEALAQVVATVAGWTVLAALERTRWPPPELLQDPELFAHAYVWTGIGSVWLLVLLLFGAYRRSQQALALKERELAALLAERDRQAEALAIANMAKARFLESIGHELRTPIASLIGALEVARTRGGLSAIQMRQLYATSVHLLWVVDNLLDLRRLESGELRPRIVGADPAKMLSQAVASLQPIAEAHEGRLDLELGSMPVCVALDEEKTRRLLSHLLMSLLEWRPQQKILVRAAADADRLEIVIEAGEEGVRHLARLLDEGGEDERLRSATIRGLLELLGAQTLVQATPGRPTALLVRVPIRPCQEQQVLARTRRGERPRILIVDDQTDLQAVFAHYCEVADWEADAVSSPEEALEALREHEYDLILLDLRMPGTDGFAGVRMLRQAFPERTLRIVALTAHVLGDDEHALRQAGFDGFIGKPIGLADFLDRVRAILQEGPGG